MHSFPTCPHRLGESSFCGYACKHTGFKIAVSPVLCSASCKAWGGPQQINEPDRDTANFLRKMLQLQFSGGGEGLGTWGRTWADKVLRKYVVSTQLAEPREDIMTAAQVLSIRLKQDSSLSVSRVCLTGSVITSHDKNPKDVDICVVTDNLIGDLASIEKIVPPTVADLKTDLFVMGTPSSFFLSLDVDTLELFMSAKAKIVGVPDAYTVVRSTGHWGWIDDQVKSLLEEMRRDTSASFDELLKKDALNTGCCDPPAA